MLPQYKPKELFELSLIIDFQRLEELKTRNYLHRKIRKYMEQYYIIFKPYNVLSQFSKEGPEDVTLSDLNFTFPKEVYPVGRLDKDSEGLLLLSNDKTLNIKLLNPKKEHTRTYWVQVEGEPTSDALLKLTKGVDISINGKTHRTLPANVDVLEEEETKQLPPRNPPIRFRANIPTTWLALTLIEGKNRQVRRMCAAIGYPVLRLVRWSMESATIEGMRVGEVRIVDKTLLHKQLNIKPGPVEIPVEKREFKEVKNKPFSPKSKSGYPPSKRNMAINTKLERRR